LSRPFNAQRLALLVDVQNIYYPAKSLGDKVDFHSLLRRFNNRNLVRAIAYVVEAPDVDISPFVTALTSIGFEVKTKPIKIFDDGTRKGDIDMMLALDALSIADKVDVVCMVTGDGVYVDLVHHLHARGVKVELMSFKSNTSSELMRICDSHVGMNEEFLLGYERGRNDRPRNNRGDGRHARSNNYNNHRNDRDDRNYGNRYEERSYNDRDRGGYNDRNYNERSYNERTYERNYQDRGLPNVEEDETVDAQIASDRSDDS
jgi:uncharacterized LabA/DUF88 family protein